MTTNNKSTVKFFCFIIVIVSSYFTDSWRQRLWLLKHRKAIHSLQCIKPASPMPSIYVHIVIHYTANLRRKTLFYSRRRGHTSYPPTPAIAVFHLTTGRASNPRGNCMQAIDTANDRVPSNRPCFGSGNVIFFAQRYRLMLSTPPSLSTSSDHLYNEAINR